MSTPEQMIYLEGEQTLRNKDYVTVTRYEYNCLKDRDTRLFEHQLKLREQRLKELECSLIKREREIEKQMKLYKYDLNKKIRGLADDILKME